MHNCLRTSVAHSKLQVSTVLFLFSVFQFNNDYDTETDECILPFLCVRVLRSVQSKPRLNILKPAAGTCYLACT